MIQLDIQRLGQTIIQGASQGGSAQLQPVGRPVDLGRSYVLHRFNLVDTHGLTLVDDAAHLVLDACGGFELFVLDESGDPRCVQSGHLRDFIVH